MDIRTICAVVMAAFAACQLVHILSMISSRFASISDDHLTVGIHKPNLRRSLIGGWHVISVAWRGDDTTDTSNFMCTPFRAFHETAAARMIIQYNIACNAGPGSVACACWNRKRGVLGAAARTLRVA